MVQVEMGFTILMGMEFLWRESWLKVREFGRRNGKRR